MAAVVGTSSSSGADLDPQLAALGTNLLTVEPGNTLAGAASLPPESGAMIARIGPMEKVAATGKVPDALVYRTDQVPAAQSGGPGSGTSCAASRARH